MTKNVEYLLKYQDRYLISVLNCLLSFFIKVMLFEPKMICCISFITFQRRDRITISNDCNSTQLLELNI